MLFMLLLHLLFCSASFFALSMPKTPDEYQRAYTALDCGYQSSKYMTVSIRLSCRTLFYVPKVQTCGMTFSGM